MNNKKIQFVVLILVVCAFIIVACSAKNEFIGTWKNAQNGDTIEFLENGTIKMNSFGYIHPGGYKILDDSKIQIDMLALLGLGGAQIYQYKISGSTLTLEINGVALSFTKE